MPAKFNKDMSLLLSDDSHNQLSFYCRTCNQQSAPFYYDSRENPFNTIYGEYSDQAAEFFDWHSVWCGHDLDYGNTIINNHRAAKHTLSDNKKESILVELYCNACLYVFTAASVKEALKRYMPQCVNGINSQSDLFNAMLLGCKEFAKDHIEINCTSLHMHPQLFIRSTVMKS